MKRLLLFAGILIAATVSYNPKINSQQAPSQAALQDALWIYQGLTGITPDAMDPTVAQMTADIAAGNPLQAAQRVISGPTAVPGFYNFLVRNMFASMSTESEISNAPTNDFVATGVGVVYNNDDARDLLQGNYRYEFDPAKVTGIFNPTYPDYTNLVLEARDGEGYLAWDLDFATRSDLNMGALLSKAPQIIVDSTQGNVINHPTPSGLLTTRGFFQNHENAGTARRAVRYAFREFECIDILDFAGPGDESWISRDVDRCAGGCAPGQTKSTLYQSTCVMCHNRLDAMRGAFAYFDFGVSEILTKKYGGNTDIFFGDQTHPDVAYKMNKNPTVFPAGHVVSDDSWMNPATDPTSQQYFGWAPGTTSGNGIQSFGHMLASSKAFPRCMAMKVFKAVCGRDPFVQELGTVNAIGDNFALQGYKFQSLFAQVAVIPSCLGLQ